MLSVKIKRGSDNLGNKVKMYIIAGEERIPEDAPRALETKIYNWQPANADLFINGETIEIIMAPVIQEKGYTSFELCHFLEVHKAYNYNCGRSYLINVTCTN